MLDFTIQYTFNYRILFVDWVMFYAVSAVLQPYNGEFEIFDIATCIYREKQFSIYLQFGGYEL